jgi:PAS domain S-box-containing protein
MINQTGIPNIAETRAAFFKRLVTVAVLTNLFFFGLAAFSLFQTRRHYEERAEISTQNLTRMFATQIGGDIDKIDLVLQTVAEEAERQLAAGGIDARALNATIGRQQDRLPVLDGLRVVNAGGMNVYGTGVNPGVWANIADRAYFLQLRDDPQAGLVISEPVLGRVSQKWSIILARRVTGPDGSFAGLVYGSMTLEQFIKAFTSVDVGPRGSISLRGETLAQIVRYPEPEDFGRVVGQTNGSPELMAAVRRQPEAGTYRTARSADRVLRTYSYRRITNRPLYLIIGLAEADYLAAWRGEAAGISALGVIFLLGTLLAARLFYRDWLRRIGAEAALRESEGLYRKLFDLESDAVLLVDCQTHRLMDVNLSALQLYGYSREELLQKTPEDLSDEPEKTRAAVGSGHIYVPLRWHRKKDGTRFAVEITANQIEYRGRLMELAALRDVTQRQQVLERLQDMTGQLVEAQHMAGLGSYVLDARTGEWTGSEVLDKLFGITDRDFVRNVSTWLQILHPQDRPEMERYLTKEVLAGRTPFDRQYRIIRLNDREVRWVHGLGKLVLDGQGRVIKMLGIIQDITEHKQSEATQARLATAVEQSAESIVIADTTGTILYVNPAFEKITGYPAGEAVGQNTRLLKSGRHEAAFYRRLWETLGRGETWTGHFTNRRKDGKLIEEEASISPVRDKAGKIVNYVAVKRDVTREMELDLQFRQMQKMEAIGQLAGGVAHDFNNILTALLIQTSMLERIDDLSLEVREGLKQIRQAANSASELTRQLLMFSRRQVMQPRQLDLNEVVTQLARMLQRIIGEDVHLELRLFLAPLRLRADAGMIEQVLMNLSVNARDVMPQGGQLVIETTETMVNENLEHLNPEAVPGRYVCLSVSDTGGGIPPEVLPRIFEPFFTTKEVGKGTGLGLATVFGIVKQHRGWIKVDNELGRGATFRIYLPASMAAEAEAAPAEAASKTRQGTETILMAEDEPSVRKTLRLLLEDNGYRVLEAANGTEALKLWQTQRGSVALLLTDLVMPGGVNGQELARRLELDQPQLKVVFMSGYSVDIAGREFQLRPGENFLQKPFPPAQLLQIIRRSLDAKAPAR